MKPIVKILIAASALLTIIFLGTTSNVSGRFSSEKFFYGMKQGELDSVLIKMANKFNESLPMMINLDTRLDSTIGINKQFRYNYTMVEYTTDELDVNYFRKKTQPKLINMVCTTAEMRGFVSNGVPVIYAYHTNDGEPLTIFTVDPSQCKIH